MAKERKRYDPYAPISQKEVTDAWMQRAAPVISEGQLERAAAFDERIITENERLKRDNGELHAKLKRANERVREADLRLERMGNALTAVIRAFYEFGKPSDSG